MFIRGFHDWELEEVEAFFRRLHDQTIRRDMEDNLI